jgi:FkbM family methyltransferase
MGMQLLITKVLVRLRHAVWRALTAIQPDRIYSFRLPDGARFEYPLASAIGRHLFARWFEPAELSFVREHLGPGDVVLDVGANAGLYTVIAARIVGPGGHVYAFEPDQRAAALLRRNVSINALTNVTVIEAAASNETGMAPFAAADDTALSSLADINRDDQRIQEWRTVQTIRLDDAVTKHGIGSVSFMKMDVEGAEKLVLDGSQHLLSRAAKGFTILFEGFDQNTRAFGYTVRELLDMLPPHGFSLHGFDTAQQLRPVAELESGIGSTVYNFVAFKS